MAPNLSPVAGKTAIITGAGSGINLAFAQLLLEKGCNVVIADLALRPEAQETVKQYSATPKAVFQKCDVTVWRELEALFDVANEHFGGADIVCPGAGVYEPPFSNFWVPPGTGSSADAPDSNSYKTLDINITHPLRLTQLALAHFLQATGQHQQPCSPGNPKAIIHISSIAAQSALLSTPLYIASKHAVSGFVRSLAGLRERKGVAVTAVAPGVIKTPLWTEHPEKMRMVVDGSDEWVTPEDVARVMLDLVEDSWAEHGKEKYRGGEIVEVGRHTRKVELLMDPGPAGAGNTVSNHQVVFEEIYDGLKPGWGVPEE